MHDDPLVGLVLEGRYQLVDCLGTGGTGFVYLAEHLGLGRDVAVKMLFSDRAQDPINVKRLMREAQMLAALDHPGIVKVLDYGSREDGTPFLVMEKVNGKPLDLVLGTAEALDPYHALHIGWQLADALHAAHSVQIIHRDLKPANIQLCEAKMGVQARILDFGFAFLREGLHVENTNSGARLTRQGVIFGTPEYMAPEQIRGGLAEARSDLYALGIVLYEMLTGNPPYRGSAPVQIFYRHLEQPTPPLRLPTGLDAQMASDIRDLVNSLLQKSLDGRPSSALEVAERLRLLCLRFDPNAVPRVLRGLNNDTDIDSLRPNRNAGGSSNLLAGSEELTRPRSASGSIGV